MGNATRASVVAAASQNKKPAPRKCEARPAISGLEFDALGSDLRRSLAPASPLENLLTERAILAAYRMHEASRDSFAACRRGEALPPLSRQEVRAERSLELAIELLQTVRRFGSGHWGQAAALGARAVEPCASVETEDDGSLDDDADFSNEWPVIPGREYQEHEEPEDVAEDAMSLPRWQERLVFDDNVSATSPVVKGTWVTVGHVVSLIVDGWTWSDILRSHPELTEDDVRTCLAYTAELDDRGEY
jgi:uncharacterized protein (DUF433 family)